MNILSVRNLKKYYNTGENTVKALDGIDLDICKGEFLAVVGTSGSGKSTLLHMLGGLDNPTSGEIIIDGRNISGLSRDELTVYRRRKIGFVFQNYNLLPLMNVYENIVLAFIHFGLLFVIVWQILFVGYHLLVFILIQLHKKTDYEKINSLFCSH